MESCNQRHYESIKKALESACFVVDNIQKKGKKTVITILRSETGKEIANPEEDSAIEYIKEIK